jgi:TPR repeat protein
LAKGFIRSKKAAEKGDALGMRLLANCYVVGKGVDHSPERAMF